MKQKLKALENKYDCLIIGAGPAGMTAGIYLARKKIKTLLISKDIGGQTAISGEVANYPGIPNTNGVHLAMQIKKHLDLFKDVVEVQTGVSIKTFSGQFPKYIVTTEKGDKFETKTIIIASGSVPRKLNIPGEKEFLRKGVSYCATCDAPLFPNKKVAVVGGGNSGLEAVIELNKIAEKIYLITNGPKLTGDKIYIEQIEAYNKVEIILNSTANKIIGKAMVEGLEIENLIAKNLRTIEIDGIFVEIGYLPATKFLPNIIKLNKWGEVKVDKNNMSSAEGVFAAGDVANKFGKQTVIAAGDGARAALGVAHLLVLKKIV